MLERFLRIRPFKLREGRWRTCPDCNGAGGVMEDWDKGDLCWPCDGVGRRFVSTEEAARRGL